MTQLSISTATAVFSHASNLDVRIQRQDFVELRELGWALDRLGLQLGESRGDEYWRKVLRFPYYLKQVFSLTPIHPTLILDNDPEALNSFKAEADWAVKGYSSSTDAVGRLTAAVEALLKVDTNPMFTEVTRIIEENDGTSGLLIKDAKLLTTVTTFMDRQGVDVEVINPSALKSGRIFKVLICCGPARWFERNGFEFIHRSPRAPRIIFLSPAFVGRDGLETRSPFKGTEVRFPFSTQSDGPTISLPQPVSVPNSESDDQQSMDIDWNEVRLGRKIESRDGRNEGGDREEVDARLITLEGNNAVFLEVDDHSYSFIIDPAAIDGEANLASDEGVRKTVCRDVELGMYLLLRTDAGGDYIEPLANTILGLRCSHYRALQTRWKMALREYLDVHGTERTVEELRRLGSGIANKSNLRNWISRRLIKPRNDKDFEAIISIAGLSRDYREYLHAALITDRAHKKAGVQIKGDLLKRVKTSSLSNLTKHGIMEFTLPGKEQVSLTAFRVTGIAPGSETVPSSEIGVPFQYSQDTWSL